MDDSHELRQPTSSGRRTRFDPRLTLALTVAAIVATFAAASWWRLVLLAGVALAVLAAQGELSAFRKRLRWLRWFLLFIVLLHVLLSPGHTLFGVSWLSRDGLWRGGQVSLQVVTALAFSLTLTRSTPPEEMAAAFLSLLWPLQRFGLQIGAFADHVLVTLRFVPVLKEEGAAAALAVRGRGEPVGVAERISRLQSIVLPLLISLLDRAERLAQAAAVGQDPSPQPAELGPFRPWSGRQLPLLVFSVLVVSLYGVLP